MDPLWIVLIGMVVVVGGILVLRLHAFLALLAGALVVGALTPAAAIERFALEQQRFEILSIAPQENRAVLAVGKGPPPRAGTLLLAVRPDPPTGRWREAGTLRVVEPVQTAAAGGKAQGAVSVMLQEWRGAGTLGEGDVVVTPERYRAARTLAGQTMADRVAAGFGSTATSIGILIAMASVVGRCLLDSGAADRIVRSTLRLLGEARAGLAFLSSGFVLGIPVFFDTVFYLMIPLGKAMRLQTGRNYLLYVLAIVAGATMTHSLVPPTPGPLFVAAELKVDMGLMILGGCVVGLFSSATGYLYARWANRTWEVPLRDLPAEAAEGKAVAKDLPPLWLSLLPVVLPVALIGGVTVLEQALPAAEAQSPAQAGLLAAAQTLGDKNIALTLAAAIALGTLAWWRRVGREGVAQAVQASLMEAGVIILITSAGGAFGAVLQQTGIATRIRDLSPAAAVGVLPLAFLVTALIRTAQGSATVAMITAVGVLASVADPSQLGFHPLYLALAIGCGSKPLSWMNDSGFWVICKMSGMTEAETLRGVTPMTALMGAVGLGVTMLGAWLFPLV